MKCKHLSMDCCCARAEEACAAERMKRVQRIENVLLVVLVLAAVGALLWGCARPKARPRPDLPVGTIFVTRNLDETLNTSPGYWNHLAIYVGDDRIVESQEQGGVIETHLDQYFARAYASPVLQVPRDPTVGEKAANKAKTLVGLPYRKLSSMLRVDRREKSGVNCVSVVRISYAAALDKKLPDLRIPDDIFLFKQVFREVTWSELELEQHVNDETTKTSDAGVYGCGDRDVGRLRSDLFAGRRLAFVRRALCAARTIASSILRVQMGDAGAAEETDLVARESASYSCALLAPLAPLVSFVFPASPCGDCARKLSVSTG